MSKDIHPTLARVYEISGFTKPSQLSNSLNIGASTITNWAKRGVSRDGALLASEKFGASADYILKGANPSIALSSGIDKEVLDDHIVIGQQTKYPLVKIKYLDIKASCGPGYSNDDYPDAFTQTFTVEFLRANGLPIDGKGLILMHACGDSMGYTIPCGTVILVNTNEAFFDSLISNKIYVFNANGEMICKRAIKNIDGSVTIKSDNSNKDIYPDYQVNKENFEHFAMFGRVRYVFMQM